MANGRSANSLRNVTTGLFNKLLMMFLAFATRTLFVRLLGAEYTGVSSLYSNILSVLSLAEMGIGNVLMFNLYGALKNRDENEIVSLTNEFKRIYMGIIILVLSVGLLLVPFLKYIVHSSLNDTELIGYYLLYLINSVASYFVVYRTMVLAADQKNYISNIVHSIGTITMYVLQIVYLLAFRDFWGYLIIQVLCTVGVNLALNFISLKKYPFLKNKPKVQKDNQVVERKTLFKNIKATFLFKISDTILDQTDNILISMLFGTVVVGYYANYYMLISYIVAIAGIIANGLVASFGNLNAEGNMEQSYKMFRLALLAFSIFGTVCTACYASIVQPFIPIWIGSQYVMPYSLVIAVLAVFYVRMATNTMWMYRSAMGLFQEVQYINIAAAILNIILSILLGRLMGVSGVIAATAIARLLTSFWYEGRVVFKKFDKPVTIYYVLQMKYFAVCAVCTLLTTFVCQFVPGEGIVSVLLKAVISFVFSSILMLAIYGRTAEFKEMVKKIAGVIRH